MSGQYSAIVIGASAGALDAVGVILSALPAEYPLPVMIVVHIPPARENIIPALLQPRAALTLKEAEDKEPILPGHAYFAPPDYHLLVEQDKILSLSNEEPVLFSRPSVNVLFESAADAYGEGLIGVVLTGANDDGAAGLRAIAAAGGTALVQDPEDAYAPYMPESAIRACPGAEIFSLPDLAARLCEYGARA